MWLRSNKLSLNIQKSSFVNLSSSTKKDFLLILENKCLNQGKVYKISRCLHWLKFVMEISDSSILTKIKRSVGTSSKIRYYVDINVLSNFYYALIYPFLIYGIIMIALGNTTYSTTLQPLFILQKRAIRLMTFTRFHEHSSPIFRKLKTLNKLDDLISYYIAVFMYRFNNCLLLLVHFSLK